MTRPCDIKELLHHLIVQQFTSRQTVKMIMINCEGMLFILFPQENNAIALNIGIVDSINDNFLN